MILWRIKDLYTTISAIIGNSMTFNRANRTSNNPKVATTITKNNITIIHTYISIVIAFFWGKRIYLPTPSFVATNKRSKNNHKNKQNTPSSTKSSHILSCNHWPRIFVANTKSVIAIIMPNHFTSSLMIFCNFTFLITFCFLFYIYF